MKGEEARKISKREVHVCHERVEQTGEHGTARLTWFVILSSKVLEKRANVFVIQRADAKAKIYCLSVADVFTCQGVYATVLPV